MAVVAGSLQDAVVAVFAEVEVALKRNLNSTEIKVKLGFTTRPWVNKALIMIFYFFYKIIINKP